MQFTKPTLSLEQMIDLLKQRDLIFDDEEKAKHYLLDRVAPNHHFIHQLQELFDEFPGVPLISMGFNTDWKEKII